MPTLFSFLPSLHSILIERPESDVEVHGVACDSRRVSRGDIFVALQGLNVDGTRFIDDAIERGAVAVITAGAVHSKVPLCRVSNAQAALGIVSREFYGRLTESFPGVAVTGTNGKTSVAFLSAQILAQKYGGALFCGTLGMAALSAQSDVIDFSSFGLTSPDSLMLHRELAVASGKGARSFALEFSSHALDQERISGVSFDCCVFTNLTRDHLDYHGTEDKYFEAKRKLFDIHLKESSKATRSAVINIDDPFGARLARELTDVRVITFSMRSSATIQLVEAQGDSYGTEFTLSVDGANIRGRWGLIGEYNQENLLAVVGAAIACGISPQELPDLLSLLKPVPGRLEPVTIPEPGELPRVFVDYAHTPDALEKAQRSLRPLCKGRLISVFGCGGDRDRGKRPVMGKIAVEGADMAIVTSDNPRTEDPEAIVLEILRGVPSSKQAIPVVDRRSAIKEAIFRGRSGDVILIAGKGHEPYQEIAGVRHPFSDQAVAREMLKERAERLA